MNNMNANTKLEIAVEIMAAKIAMASMQNFKMDSQEMKALLKDREEMYKGNEIIINRIIKEYGPEIKKNYEEA